VAFVLLIACANVAGLLLARAASRRTEVAIRSAIGAGRGRMVRQMLTESVLLAALGGIAGTALAWVGLRVFVATAPPRMLPHLKEIGLDPPVLAFTAVVAILTGLLFGIVPALQASRSDLTDALKDSSRSASSGVARHRFRSALVTVQIGLALVLLIGAGLMINSFVRLEHSDLGVDPQGLLVFDFRFPPLEVLKVVSRYRGVGLWEINPKASLTFDRVLEGVRRIPGVTSAAGSTMPPLQGAINMNFLIEGRPAPPSGTAGGSQQTAAYTAITPNYFATMKIPILRGRDLTDRDNLAGTLVAIINQSMAKRYWPNEDPIGKHITFDLVPDEKPREIVAIVADTRLSRTQRQPGPIVYVPHEQQESHWVGPNLGPRTGMYFVLRTNGDPMGVVPSVRQVVREVDRNKALSYIRTVEQTLEQQAQYIRAYVILLAVFGVIAAVLAAIGIYGMMAFSVAQRTHEIGIRMALGASAGQVLGLIVRQALVLIVIGLTLGLAGSFALTRLIVQQLWGVTPTDPLTFAGVSLFLTMVALLACFIPTRQAARVDPSLALRTE
jgi:putative ABC transport system permease protein